MEMNDDILISYLLGEASPEEVQQVDQWRASDKAHNARFEQFKLIWETSLNFKYTGEPDAVASLQSLKQKIALQKNTGAKVVPFSRDSLWLKVAAAILIMAGGLFYLNQRPVPQLQLASGKVVKIDTLSDGSVVTLNKASVLNYPERFTGEQRHVILAKGEAFFNVTHNKALPFIITAGGATIRVVGTSFNVKNKDGNVEVIVETGIVQVTCNGNTIVLKPGEKVLTNQNIASLAKEKSSDQLYNYYRSKEFIADNTPLSRMVAVLNEAYNSNIVIGRAELNNLPLNTTFKNESLEDILAIISRTFKLTIERTNGRIIIK